MCIGSDVVTSRHNITSHYHVTLSRHNICYLLDGLPVRVAAHVLQGGGVEAHQAAHGVEQLHRHVGGGQQVGAQGYYACVCKDWSIRHQSIVCLR
jgi:hypothetical protein